MYNIFTYGTLMFDAVWARVVAGEYRHSPGTISGFVRKTVQGATYPAVYPSGAENIVEGVVYFNVDSGDLASLDAFEGDYYDRKEVTCRLSDGSQAKVWIYIWKEKYMPLVSEADWDPEWFSREGLGVFISNYGGFGEGDA